MRPCFASLIVVAVSLHASAVPTTNSNGSVMTPNSELTRNQLVATDVSGLLSSESDPNVVFTNGELLVHGERVKIGPDETEVQEIASAVVAPVASSVTNLSSSVSDLQSSKADRSEIPGNYLSVSNKAMTAVQAESDPTVYAWAKQPNPPAETDPTVKPWAKADKPPAETDPTVHDWAKQPNPPKGMTTNAVERIANAAVETNALTVATTNRVALLESSKADNTALTAHVANTDNPHAVTAAQVGAVPLVEDVIFEMTAVTIGSRKDGEPVGEYSFANGAYVEASADCSHAEGSSTTASGYRSHAEGSGTTAAGEYSHAEGDYTTADGDCSHAEGSSTTASGYCSHAEGNSTTASGYCSHAEGSSTTAAGDCSHAEGLRANTKEQDDYAFAWNGDATIVDATISGRYNSHGPGTFNINPAGGLNGFYIGEQTLYTILTNKADKADISAENQTFSNAVLAVGLNIDTNSVAVLNDIAATFGGFPLGAGETATTVGGLLAALAAAVAWLKKNKVGSFASVGGATATVENGVAKLDNFFTESNSLLTATIDARLPYPLYAVPSTGILKDRAINTTSLASVTVPENFTDLLIRATVASSLAVTMPVAIATKYGDTFPGEAGEYLITITKTGAAEAYVRTIKLEEVANA